MGFCYFCWQEADKLKKEIEFYQEELGILNCKLILADQETKNIKKSIFGIKNGEHVETKTTKIKLIKTVKEALIARNMTEGEANNVISLLLK